MQQVDFTTIAAVCSELLPDWIPARLEQVYQRDRFTIALGLRTLKHRGWLTLCWHPQAARMCLGDPPPRTPDTFTFSQQLKHQLGSLALVSIDAIAPWERVLDLQFAQRPQEPAKWHLYVEIMGKYSNVILTDADNLIVTAAHQVSSQQSRVRPIQTGQPYELPPSLTEPIPSRSESLERWQERVSLIPGKLVNRLLKSYRGLGSVLAASMVRAADLDPDRSTDSLEASDWHRLFLRWQEWLEVLGEGGQGERESRGSRGSRGAGAAGEQGQHFQLNTPHSTLHTPHSKLLTFSPGFTAEGYTVMGWGVVEPVGTVQELLNRYYTEKLEKQEFAQLHHQLSQKANNLLLKLRQKATSFEERLQQSDGADLYKQQADLLMAHLHEWQPGMKSIVLSDFETEKAIAIPLEPEKNAIQNAQALYRRHQKLKRARSAVEPLLAEVKTELQYLEQVEESLVELDTYQAPEDLLTLLEIRDELIAQGYLDPGEQRRRSDATDSQPYSYRTPSGFELLIGRNNRQNDRLTFRVASDYDLWFHTQEIAGSHVLLRLPPGSVPDETDLQFAADLAAYYSRGRQSDRVAVVYTAPKHVYKPKGAKPGMALYQHERILWGCPQQGEGVR
jgi:predicted ribosome quality control (RQC) complex YloA/Tae2 family protein